MSPYVIDLKRGEESLTIPMDDMNKIDRTICERGGPSILRSADDPAETITAAQGRTIADALDHFLPPTWDEKMMDGFLAFLRRGPFDVEKVCLGFEPESIEYLV